jgi:hypothetical protein
MHYSILVQAVQCQEAMTSLGYRIADGRQTIAIIKEKQTKI